VVGRRIGSKHAEDFMAVLATIIERSKRENTGGRRGDRYGSGNLVMHARRHLERRGK